MVNVDTILVSFTTDPECSDILIVARKMANGDPDIINAVEGPDARELYEKLVKEKHMDVEYEEVDFDKYCKTCRHESLDEWEEPCNECLEHGMNIQTSKPTEWEGWDSY